MRSWMCTSLCRPAATGCGLYWVYNVSNATDSPPIMGSGGFARVSMDETPVTTSGMAFAVSEKPSTSCAPVVEAEGAALGVVFTLGTAQSTVLTLAASGAELLTPNLHVLHLRL